VTVLAEVVDPDGRRVDLTIERWDHIVDDHDGHPELGAHIADVMLTVSEPHERAPAAAITNGGTSVGTSAQPLAPGSRSL
jgi:hypothetical protein